MKTKHEKNRKIGNNLKVIREYFKISRENFSKVLMVNEVDYIDYEHGFETTPDVVLNNLFKWMDLPNYILNYDLNEQLLKRITDKSTWKKRYSFHSEFIISYEYDKNIILKLTSKGFKYYSENIFTDEFVIDELVVGDFINGCEIYFDHWMLTGRCAGDYKIFVEERMLKDTINIEGHDYTKIDISSYDFYNFFKLQHDNNFNFLFEPPQNILSAETEDTKEIVTVNVKGYSGELAKAFFDGLDQGQSSAMGNAGATGYMILAMKSLEYTDDEIKKVEAEMKYQFDMKSIKEAEKVYQQF